MQFWQGYYGKIFFLSVYIICFLTTNGPQKENKYWKIFNSTKKNSFYLFSFSCLLRNKFLNCWLCIFSTKKKCRIAVFIWNWNKSVRAIFFLFEEVSFDFKLLLHFEVKMLLIMELHADLCKLFFSSSLFVCVVFLSILYGKL